MTYRDYEAETLKEAAEDLRTAVVGRRIVAVETETLAYGREQDVLTLDNGKQVTLEGYGDCCAWAGADIVGELVQHDNAITSVTTTENGEEWFVYVGAVPVLEFSASASEGSGYYGYGISINVRDVPE